jgi:hypothetical protein
MRRDVVEEEAAAGLLLLLEAAGRRELLRLATTHEADKLAGLAASALSWATQESCLKEFHALDVAAEALEAARAQLSDRSTGEKGHPTAWNTVQ